MRPQLSPPTEILLRPKWTADGRQSLCAIRHERMIVIDVGRAAPSLRLAGAALRRRPCAGRDGARGEGAAMRPGPSRPGGTNPGGAPMNILLFSMPDSFEHMPTIAIRLPNGALTSLGGNVDPHPRVAAAGLLLVQDRVRETVERLVAEHEPDVVGLSVMTFQRKLTNDLAAPWFLEL